MKKKRLSPGWLGLIMVLAAVDLGLLLRRLLEGNDVMLFNPQGLIAKQEHSLMINVAILLLAVAVPSVLLLYFIAWKYRESNTNATYSPDLRHGKWFNLSAWGVPTIFMLTLASIMIPATHKLQPRKAIASDVRPMVVQVISLRWKWLFMYPEQGIATVNFVEVPVGTPVQFEMTADETPMSSFWIPNLGGQLYTMTGHVNRLNLIADAPGDYRGSSAELNGAGFTGMKFTARASDKADFDLWVQAVKQSKDALDAAEYAHILKPSENNPVAFYSVYDNDLYDKVILKYEGPGGGHQHTQ